jgi:hypothetical protein
MLFLVDTKTAWPWSFSVFAFSRNTRPTHATNFGCHLKHFGKSSLFLSPSDIFLKKLHALSAVLRVCGWHSHDCLQSACCKTCVLLRKFRSVCRLRKLEEKNTLRIDILQGTAKIYYSQLNLCTNSYCRLSFVAASVPIRNASAGVWLSSF